MQTKRAWIMFLGVMFGVMIGLILFQIQSITGFQVFDVDKTIKPNEGLCSGIEDTSEKSCCNDPYECLVKVGDNYHIKDWNRFISFNLIDTLKIGFFPPNSTRIMNGWVEELLPSYAKINSDGFRGRDYSVNKPQNTSRIILLGDSFVYGYGLNDTETIAYKLENELNKDVNGHFFEVLNLGVGGYNTEMEMKRFFEKGEKYNPDYIILFYFRNDYEDYNAHMNFWTILRDKYNVTGISAGKIIESQLLPSYYRYLYQSFSKNQIFNEKVFFHYKKLISYCKENNIDLLFVAYPADKIDQNILKKFFVKEDVNSFFLTEIGYKYIYPWTIGKIDYHPSSYANERVVKEIVNKFFNK